MTETLMSLITFGSETGHMVLAGLSAAFLYDPICVSSTLSSNLSRSQCSEEQTHSSFWISKKKCYSESASLKEGGCRDIVQWKLPWEKARNSAVGLAVFACPATVLDRCLFLQSQTIFILPLLRIKYLMRT